MKDGNWVINQGKKLFVSTCAHPSLHKRLRTSQQSSPAPWRASCLLTPADLPGAAWVFAATLLETDVRKGGGGKKCPYTDLQVSSEHSRKSVAFFSVKPTSFLLLGLLVRSPATAVSEVQGEKSTSGRRHPGYQAERWSAERCSTTDPRLPCRNGTARGHVSPTGRWAATTCPPELHGQRPVGETRNSAWPGVGTPGRHQSQTDPRPGPTAWSRPWGGGRGKEGLLPMPGAQPRFLCLRPCAWRAAVDPG